MNTEPGTVFEAALWYDPEREGARTEAENACRDALLGEARAHGVVLGPVAWSDCRPGDARVPSLPSHMPRRTLLLRAEATVIARQWFEPKPQRFSHELGADDLKRLRAITRRAWAESYRKRPYRHLKPWLSDAEADFLIDEIGEATALKMLAEGK